MLRKIEYINLMEDFKLEPTENYSESELFKAYSSGYMQGLNNKVDATIQNMVGFIIWCAENKYYYHIPTKSWKQSYTDEPIRNKEYTFEELFNEFNK